MSRAHLLISLVAIVFAQSIHGSPLPQDGDGGGTGSIPDGSLGYDPSAEGDAQPGSSGADSGGVRLGKGAIIAISVVAGVIVVAGITMAVLFWGAKKRQWAVAETMRRSVRRVTTGLKNLTPRTPHRMTFSPIEKTRAGDIGDELLRSKSRSKPKGSLVRGERDAEKSPGASTAVVGGSRDRSGSSESFIKPASQNAVGGNGGRKQRPVPPRVQVPSSKFEMESPKTPMWNRVFGR